ncbi:hypothetical protein JW921_03390 [Candidatus Fermentibacterales bacterium]|nr:hypothetical protein [Candidatus Fermentibacterales bacterium]
MSGTREGSFRRKTRETDLRTTLGLDRFEFPEVSVQLPFLGHMLEALAVHAGVFLGVRGTGDLSVDPHHLIEDCGICLGRALCMALEAGGPVARIGWSIVPMDGSLATTALDLCGRPNLVWKAEPGLEALPDGTSPSLYRHFFKGFVDGSGSTLHVILEYSDDGHHAIECIFKSFGRSLGQSVTLRDEAVTASSKGVLDG